eukprot:6661682-Pyramimonas_sp.AAC.1
MARLIRANRYALADWLPILDRLRAVAEEAVPLVQLLETAALAAFVEPPMRSSTPSSRPPWASPTSQTYSHYVIKPFKNLA